MRSSLALIALIALCVSVGARADTDEPFNGAVHSDPGVDAVPDDGMTEEAHAVQWIDVEMNGDIFVTRKSWQPPQYHLEDDTYVRMRGWVSTIRAAAAGEAVFRLPEDARPGRAEPWKVSMKGTDREILLGKFILIIVWANRLTSPVLFTGPARVPLRVRVHLQRGSMQRSAVGVRAHRFAHGHDAEVVGRKQDFLRGVCVGSQGRK